MFSKSIKSFHTYGNTLVLDCETNCNEIFTHLALMSQYERQCLEEMESKRDLLRSNVTTRFSYL
jgi:hypothetical protein